MNLATTLAAAGVLGALVAGCATPTAQAPQVRSTGVITTHVDVDTPTLRATKKRAHIAPCPKAVGSTTTSSSGMPEITLPCLGGGPAVNLASIQGPAVVNLFAQWCGPCRAELPFYQRLHERAGSKLPVLGIDYQDTQPQKALELAQETGVTYPLLADPDAATRVPFRVRGLPGVVLIDQDGTTHVEYVVIRSYAQLRDLVHQHLGLTV